MNSSVWSKVVNCRPDDKRWQPCELHCHHQCLLSPHSSQPSREPPTRCACNLKQNTICSPGGLRLRRSPATNRPGPEPIDLMDEVCLAKIPDETVSMRCGGDGFAVFFGLAMPVRAPVIGSQVRRW